MKKTIKLFDRLMDYETGEVTAAATYYLAEIYGNFSKSLMSSERPDDLDEMELEQYELALEEQAYPFEEKSIEAHESNLQLISRGVYNEWVDKSLQKLAKLVPSRYDKQEEKSQLVGSLESFSFRIDLPDQNVSPAEVTDIETDNVTGETADVQGDATAGDILIQGNEGTVAGEEENDRESSSLSKISGDTDRIEYGL